MIENNKLIAEFMGYEFIEQHSRYLITLEDFLSKENTQSYRFAKEWNWLMPVITKCRIESNEEDSHWEAIYYSLADLDIDSVYTAVVSFIKWYNENK